MERKNRAEYLALRESGKSLQEIADMHGVTKQRVHEVLQERSKREKLTDMRLRAESAELEVRQILAALKSHCSDDFVVVVDGAINWSATIEQFVAFVKLDD